jgi:voltage-gated potassium channel Kch
MTTELFCNFCSCMHTTNAFLGNHTIDANQKSFITIIKDWEYPRNHQLLVCDMSHTVVNNRYSNRTSRKATLPTVYTITITAVKVIVVLLALLVFIVLGALPIWAIESKANNTNVGVNNNKTANSTSSSDTWTYGNSVYFSVVTLTTIGYGDMVPKTLGGRVYVEIFAMFGLGLTGSLIAFVGSATLQNTHLLLLWIAINVKKLRRALRLQREPPPPLINVTTKHDLFLLLSKNEKRVFKFFGAKIVQAFLLYVLIWIYILTGSAIFSAVEDWSFSDAHWFCFVTLTTIGYGDLVPVTVGGRVLFCVYAIMGLGILASFFGLVGAAVIEYGKLGVEDVWHWINARFFHKK